MTTNPGTRIRLASLAFALTIVLVACGDDDAPDTAAGDQASTSTTSPTTSASAVFVDERTTSRGAPGSSAAPTDGKKAAPGTYNLAAIGAGNVTFELRSEGLYFTKVGDHNPTGSPVSDSHVRLGTTTQDTFGRRIIDFARPTHLVDPTFIGPPRPEVITEDDLRPVGDIEAWLDEAAAGEEWGVTDVEQTTVDGHDAWRFTLQPDFLPCASFDALAPGVRGDWTTCNGAIAWDVASHDGGGQIAVEGWDGGQSEFLWIDEVGGAPLVVSLHLGYDFDEEWNAHARALLDSVTIA